MLYRSLLSMLFILASATSHAVDKVDPRDPYEDFNRKMFKFNVAIDHYFLAPTARGYQYVMPDSAERGVLNVFQNLSEVKDAANALFQFKVKDTAIYTGRILINSTLGLGGLFDVAPLFGLDELDGEDFGQTLGYYGVPIGPYIMMPLFGPSSLRDAPSRIVDGYVGYSILIDDNGLKNSLSAFDLLSTRAELFYAEALITGDQYTFLREVYLQRRNYLVKDGELEGFEESQDSPDEFEDFDGEW